LRVLFSVLMVVFVNFQRYQAHLSQMVTPPMLILLYLESGCYIWYIYISLVLSIWELHPFWEARSWIYSNCAVFQCGLNAQPMLGSAQRCKDVLYLYIWYYVKSIPKQSGIMFPIFCLQGRVRVVTSLIDIHYPLPLSPALSHESKLGGTDYWEVGFSQYRLTPTGSRARAQCLESIIDNTIGGSLTRTEGKCSLVHLKI
jgi:hypothetical protein